jgi:hypothetical protein
MVMLTSALPVVTYQLLDDHGRSLGLVTLPRDPGVVGLGKGSVYLARLGDPRTAPIKGFGD